MRIPLLLPTVLVLSAVACRAQSPAPTNAPPAARAAPAVDPAVKRLTMLKEQPLSGSTIFGGDSFPKIELANRDLVEAAVGPVTQTERYFDAQWNEVTAPKAPGRYGELISFSAGGESWTRRVTLYKTARPVARFADPYQVSVEFPASFGVPPAVAVGQTWNIRTAARRAFAEDETGDVNFARVLAALQTIAADPARWQGFGYPYIDHAWWAELGRQRLGENQDYKYLSYFPPGYDKDPNKHWPLLLFLHGSGERGDDLKMLNKWGPLTWVGPSHPEPMIIIEPQCPADQWWDPARLARLLDRVSAAKRVDPKRIYLTGLSMGGYGTCEFAATYPQRVTAIASLSGGEDPALALRLQAIPSWFFHGADDDTVPPSMSIDLAHALQKLGAPAELTIYPGVGHGKWDMTYNHPALYSWFLSQSK